MAHRAIVIGCGRIGAGFHWPKHPYVYTHADAYFAMKKHVELVAFVEPDPERADAAAKKYQLHVYDDLVDALGVEEPDIVSVCVQPKDQPPVIEAIENAPCVKAVWCEKPYVSKILSIPTQINYLRRFERLHERTKRLLASQKLGKTLGLIITAKANEHTICHFADLSLYWDIPIEHVQYVDTSGPEYVLTNYMVLCEKGMVVFAEGGAWYSVYTMRESKVFPGTLVPGNALASGNWEPYFMENALKNILDVLDDEDGKVQLLSPPDPEVTRRIEYLERSMNAV